VKQLPTNINVDVVKHELCVENMRRENLHCMQRSMQQCHEVNLHVAKVNRMRMEDVEGILAVHPDLIVIHYVREPRAVAASRIDRGLCMDRNNPDVVNEAKLVCQRMRDDIQQRKVLESKYPTSMMTLKYENLILDPMEQGKSMYKFIGIGFPETSDWFEYAKSAIHGDVDHLSTRQNGTESIDKWKLTINHTTIAVINKHCMDVLNDLGYGSNLG
jgi:hypothetical protein